MTPLQKHTIETSKIFRGLKEKPNNSGFYAHKAISELTGMHPEDLAKAVGWKKGQAWCAIMPEIIWKLAYTKYDSTILSTLDKLFSVSVAETMSNFERSNEFTISTTPEVGSIAVWRLYDETGKIKWSGHEGLVTGFNKTHIFTDEGNTNNDGSREGHLYTNKIRKLDFTIRPSSLVLQYFIHLKEV
jgi:hypothetical protein